MSRKWKVAITTVALLACASVAFAYWTSIGSGTGDAATGSSGAITVVQTSSVAGLFPGGPAQTLSGNFNNPNAGQVFVGSITATISGVTGPNIDASNPCTAADYQLGGFPVTVNAQIPTGTGVGSWTGGTLSMVNSATNQNGCKGATVAIAYTVA